MRQWSHFHLSISFRHCYFLRGLHDGCGLQDNVFLRKNAGICRRVVEEEELIKIKVCFLRCVLKFETDGPYDAFSNGFYFLERKDRNISSA